MIIKRLLNNNVVITEDQNGEEIIVMGKGIGYQKSRGEAIDKSKLNKVFRIVNADVSNKLQELLRNIPIEYMRLSGEIIEYAEKELKKKLNEGIYISLSDHMYTAIQRIKEGIEIRNALLWEIKRFYQDEFTIGLKALEMIENETKIKLPEDEAGFIALHLVNAQMDKEQVVVQEITQLIQEVLTIVRIHLAINFKEDSVSYYRFITHLKFFATRLLAKNTYNETPDTGLLEMIQSKYVKEYECVTKIKEFIKQTYKYDLTADEFIYLTVHIAKIVRESSD